MVVVFEGGGCADGFEVGLAQRGHGPGALHVEHARRGAGALHLEELAALLRRSYEVDAVHLEAREGLFDRAPLDDRLEALELEVEDLGQTRVRGCRTCRASRLRG